ncbi:MAG: hypothetical protein ACREQ5_23960, partial [Candidatus Dormibacteria bacterium]
ALGRFSFVPNNIRGSITGASQVSPTGTDGYLYYEIMDGAVVGGGGGNGRMVGVIGYDYIQARWSCLFVADTGLTTHQNTTWENDIQEIKDFMSGLTAPTIVDEIGNDVPFGISIPPIHS